MTSVRAEDEKTEEGGDHQLSIVDRRAGYWREADRRGNGGGGGGGGGKVIDFGRVRSLPQRTGSVLSMGL